MVNSQNVTIRNINFYADYGLSEVAIQTQEATGVSFNNCVFDSFVLENINPALLIATGNYEWNNGTDEPTRYSGNVLYIPRCSDEFCSSFIDDDATLSNLTVSTGTLSPSFSSGVT